MSEGYWYKLNIDFPVSEEEKYIFMTIEDWIKLPKNKENDGSIIEGSKFEIVKELPFKIKKAKIELYTKQKQEAELMLKRLK